VANFSRILGTLLQGGLPLVPAMETAGEIDEQPADVERGHRRGGAGKRRTEPGA